MTHDKPRALTPLKDFLATRDPGLRATRRAGRAVICVPLLLWERDERAVGGDRVAARRELRGASASLGEWYEGVASALAGRGAAPSRLSGDGGADARLVEIVRRDLRDADGQATATAVKLIWTADHIDAARRLQEEIAETSADVAALRDARRTTGKQRWH